MAIIQIPLHLPDGQIRTIETPDDVPVQDLLLDLIPMLPDHTKSSTGEVWAWRLFSDHLARSLGDNETLKDAAVDSEDPLKLIQVLRDCWGFYTTAEAANELQKGHTWVRNQFRSKATRKGRRYLIPAAAIHEYRGLTCCQDLASAPVPEAATALVTTTARAGVAEALVNTTNSVAKIFDKLVRSSRIGGHSGGPADMELVSAGPQALFQELKEIRLRSQKTHLKLDWWQWMILIGAVASGVVVPISVFPDQARFLLGPLGAKGVEIIASIGGGIGVSLIYAKHAGRREMQRTAALQSEQIQRMRERLKGTAEEIKKLPEEVDRLFSKEFSQGGAAAETINALYRQHLRGLADQLSLLVKDCHLVQNCLYVSIDQVFSRLMWDRAKNTIMVTAIKSWEESDSSTNNFSKN